MFVTLDDGADAPSTVVGLDGDCDEDVDESVEFFREEMNFGSRLWNGMSIAASPGTAALPSLSPLTITYRVVGITKHFITHFAFIDNKPTYD